MDKILESIMNFINENTMLLILICIFLIIILVIYLIDNTIKTKRLEQEEKDKNSSIEPIVLDNAIPEKEEPVAIEEKEPEEKVEEPEVKVEEVKEEPKVEENNEETYANIDELLNKDYSDNNSIVENIEAGPIKEEPVVKNKYTNDKKLSDIFGKKEEPSVKKLETTQDYSDELERILQKLYSEESKIDNASLEESNDYTNMF